MAASPETPPSLAWTSRSSNLDADDIARVLFQTPELEEDGTLGYSLSGDGDKDSLFGSEFSMGTSDDETETYTQSIETYFTDADQSTLDYSTTTEGTLQRERTASGNIATACQGAISMSPVDLAGMFNLFDRGREDALGPNTPTSNATSAVTEVISNIGRDQSSVASSREIESLQRECNTLKVIIKADSANILTLKQELEAVRNLQNSDSDDDKHARVYKEREILMKRERLYMERIRNLTSELNKIIDGSSLIKRIDQLQLENELLSFQIIDMENVNRSLVEENEALNLQLTLFKRLDPVPEDGEGDPLNLKMQVASLSARLEEIENDMDRRDEEKQKRLNNDSLDSNGILVSPSLSASADSQNNEGTPMAELFASDSEVEVTLDGLIITTSSSGESQNELRKLPTSDEKGIAPPVSRFYLCDCFSNSSTDNDAL